MSCDCMICAKAKNCLLGFCLRSLSIKHIDRESIQVDFCENGASLLLNFCKFNLKSQSFVESLRSLPVPISLKKSGKRNFLASIESCVFAGEQIAEENLFYFFSRSKRKDSNAVRAGNCVAILKSLLKNKIQNPKKVFFKKTKIIADALEFEEVNFPCRHPKLAKIKFLVTRNAPMTFCRKFFEKRPNSKFTYFHDTMDLVFVSEDEMGVDLNILQFQKLMNSINVGKECETKIEAELKKNHKELDKLLTKFYTAERDSILEEIDLKCLDRPNSSRIEVVANMIENAKHEIEKYK